MNQNLIWLFERIVIAVLDNRLKDADNYLYLFEYFEDKLDEGQNCSGC